MYSYNETHLLNMDNDITITRDFVNYVIIFDTTISSNNHSDGRDLIFMKNGWINFIGPIVIMHYMKIYWYYKNFSISYCTLISIYNTIAFFDHFNYYQNTNNFSLLYQTLISKLANYFNNCVNTNSCTNNAVICHSNLLLVLLHLSLDLHKNQ